MTTIQVAKRYPRTEELRDGTAVALRPMSRADESSLVDFFRRIPAEERFFLKDEVTSQSVIRTWIEALDFDRVFPLLAIHEHRVVGDAALLLHRSASLQHAAEVRVVVDPEFRERGLAVTMIGELIEVAREAGLAEVVFEFVRDVQEQAIEAAVFLGARQAGEIEGWVRDAENKPHNVLFLKLPLQ